LLGTEPGLLLSGYFFYISLIISLISSLKESPLYLAIIGTKDNGVIPGWVFISRTNNFLPNDFFSSNLKSVLVTPLHFKNL